MNRKYSSTAVTVIWLIVVLMTSSVWSQVGYYFGQNKVRYKKFDWAVFRTEHFDVHYYPELSETAHDAARMAERGYAYLSEVLDYQVKKRIPLILYASLNDFGQTNVVGGLLDQGTRGVTEGLKNRVTLPITGSYREFNHVLVHEMVHAFQFSIMQSDAVEKVRFNPPLWFVEGMAEYISAGMDNTTRMWVRDGLLNDELLTVEQLNSVFDIRVYRLGQSLWHYIGENHGKKTVGKIFKTALRSGSLEKAFKVHLGMTSKELTKAWHDYARKISVPENPNLEMPNDVAEQITRKKSYFHRMNIAPSLSPDGKELVYVANKNLNEEIFIRSEKNGVVTDEHLVSGGKSKQYETLRFFDTSIGWSRDGQKIAFISKSGKNDVIYVMNPHTKKVLNKFDFADLNGLLSPTFSPEGDRLVFVGIRGGISDLYLLDLHSEALTRLTNGKFATLHPQWAPHSDRIAFITDKNSDDAQKKLVFSNFDLAIYHLDDNTIEMLKELPGDVTTPQWSPDGSELAFVSDHQGIPNIYRMKLADGSLTRVTSLKSGVAGITVTTPAFSWSGDGRTMVYSAFIKSSWQLFRIHVEPALPEKPRQPTPIADSDLQASVKVIYLPGDEKAPAEDAENAPAVAFEDDVSTQWLPEMPDINSLYASYELNPEESVEQRDYKSRFKLDGVALGGGYSSFFGVQGGAQFLFSDMLGDQNLFLSTELQFSDPRYSDASLTYFNQKNRINWGAQIYQNSFSYLAFGGFNSVGLVRNTFRGFNGLISYPFSRFARLELNGGLTWVNQDLVREQFTRGGIDRQTSDIGTFNYAQFGAALVFDNTGYGFMGPSSGSRSRFSIEKTTNDLDATTAFVDYRRYLRASNRTVLAWRVMGAASYGKDERFFDVGGPYTYRGADFNELFGSKFFVSNLEYRFPMFFFLPQNYDMLSGAAYLDAAGAWGIDDAGFGNKRFQPFSTDGGFHLKDLNAALGVAARLNMGYFLLQFDLAWPTDLQSFSDPVKKFSIGTFF